jgi:Spo0E like sporulation regulatory protein
LFIFERYDKYVVKETPFFFITHSPFYNIDIYHQTPYFFRLSSRNFFCTFGRRLLMDRPDRLNPVELQRYIEFLRAELVAKGLEFGFAHEATIEASHELDRYILEFQQMIAGKKGAASMA